MKHFVSEINEQVLTMVMNNSQVLSGKLFKIISPAAHKRKY